jgi:sugar lactone lactonase YvrE
VDSSGDLFISDSGNNVVREVSGGTISTVAGNGTPGYSGDGGAATSAELFDPVGLAVTAAGSLLIADYGNSVVRSVDLSTGIISTFAGGVGTGTATGVSQDPKQSVVISGFLYVADFRHSVIRKINLSTGNETIAAGTGKPGYSGDGGPATSAELNGPSGLAADSAGNLYIADTDNHVIREIAASTGTITTYAGDGTNGYTGDGGSATSGELAAPASLCVDPSGNLYIADTADNVVREVVNSTGYLATFAGTGVEGYTGDGGAASAATFGGFIAGIACDGSGNVFISDTDNYVVREVSASTGDISTVAGDGTAGYSGDGGSATSAELTYPTGLTLDSSGNLYVADQDASVVREVSASTGDISTVAGNGTAGYSGDGGSATAAELNGPTSVEADGSGDILISDEGSLRIREVNSSGTISTFSGNGFVSYSGDGSAATGAEMNQPTDLAIDSSGNVYISDSANNVIRKVSASSGDMSTYAGNGIQGYAGDGGTNYGAVEFNNPQGLAIDGSTLFVADYGNDRIRELGSTVTTFAGDGVAGESGDNGSATSATINCPTGLNYDVNGNLWFADTGNNRLRVIGGGGSF